MLDTLEGHSASAVNTCRSWGFSVQSNWAVTRKGMGRNGSHLKRMEIQQSVRFVVMGCKSMALLRRIIHFLMIRK